MSTKLIVGHNDLKTKFPRIIEIWDYGKNDKKPEEVHAYSNKSAWIICKKGHSFLQRINRLIELGVDSCPFCSGNRVLEGFNDLATTNPELLKEWDYEKNDIKPTEVSKGSHLEVWWKCKKGHSFKNKISTRTSLKTNCIYCAHQKTIIGENDLATTRPDLLKEWDYNKNTLKPQDVFANTNRKVWWVCEKGHEYEMSPSQKSRGCGCPYCVNKKILKGFNDLATTHPDLVKEWNFEKNNDISPDNISYGSDRKVWWKCKKGHEWEATINSRVAGNKCPYCDKEHHTSLPEKAIYYYIKKIFPDAIENVHLSFLGKMELDIYIPSVKLSIEYDGAKWHQRSELDKRKDNVCYANGLKVIRIMEDGCQEYDSQSIKIKSEYHRSRIDYLTNGIIEMLNVIKTTYNLDIDISVDLNRDYSEILDLLITYEKENSFANKYPQFVKYWNQEKNKSITPDMISYSSNRKYWWKCSKGHEFMMIPASLTRKKATDTECCPYCSNKRIIIGENDLFTLVPWMKDYWDFDKNSVGFENQISIGSPRNVWVKCKKGHSFSVSLVNYLKKKGDYCPYCSGRYPIIGETDLATTHPDLVKEWDYGKNGDLTPQQVSKGSDKKVWWKCSKDHEWQAVISSRSNTNCGCPYCTGLKPIKGESDLFTVRPNLAKEWNYEKNIGLDPDNISRGTTKKVWWKCSKGHEWQASVSTRSAGYNCPYCSHQKAIVGETDLGSTNPELINEWDFERNKNIDIKTVMRGSHRKVWWKCLEGHEWQASISSRACNHTGCPICHQEKRKVHN